MGADATDELSLHASELERSGVEHTNSPPYSDQEARSEVGLYFVSETRETRERFHPPSERFCDRIEKMKLLQHGSSPPPRLLPCWAAGVVCVLHRRGNGMPCARSARAAVPDAASAASTRTMSGGRPPASKRPSTSWPGAASQQACFRATFRATVTASFTPMCRRAYVLALSDAWKQLGF